MLAKAMPRSAIEFLDNIHLVVANGTVVTGTST